MGRIPFEAVDRYAERYGVEDFERFDHLIDAADRAYVSELEKKNAAERRNRANGTPRAPARRGSGRPHRR